MRDLPLQWVAVLAGQAQFALLFDGDYPVDKLADAMEALGDLAKATGSESERLAVFRRIRDEIGARMRAFIAER